ncbi:YcnI family protein [Paenibacillus sp. HB172176]|uniref:YcnI family copper-binding membrane protein n=1 Tax=Paenibacillus sp. HB172176 TaxID=2493690 RepID=UPI00143C3DE4|nr:YcnI family protein [Paenibacillus sp. HB172176]
MKKSLSVIIACFMSVLLFAGIASAHVVVYPKQTTQGAYEVFSVRVPSESEGVSTVAVKVAVPAEVNVSRIEPKPDWTYMLEKDDTGKITSVTWQAEGEGLSQTEFTNFNIQGKVADDAESIVWKAYQTYSDNSVVEWIGGEGADKPASVTVVTAAADATAGEANSDSDSNSDLPLSLSIVALVLALAALIVTFSKKKRA